MPTTKPAGDCKFPALRFFLFGLSLFLAQSSFALRLSKDTQGMIHPFKFKEVPLSEFVKEYSKITQTNITVGGRWDKELKGDVSLFIPKPIKIEALTELFHQVLLTHGYAVVDAPQSSGWIIMRSRDARDAPLPVYGSENFPATHRIITVVYNLQHGNSEHIARFMRSLMPANSRIIPQFESQLIITDSGKNLKKSLELIRQVDSEKAAKGWQQSLLDRPPNRTCSEREQKIEKLTVEHLEIKETTSSPFGGRK